MYYKCGAARFIQAGAASVDLCPKYAHVSGGQECGPPKLIVRISGGLCIVYTAQWSGNSSLVLSDCRFFLRAVGARQRKSQSTNNTAHCLSNWQTVTGSWHILPNGGPCLDWGCGRRQHILLLMPEGCWNGFLYGCRLQWAKFHQRFWNDIYFPVWQKHFYYVRFCATFAYLEISINQLEKQ